MNAVYHHPVRLPGVAVVLVVVVLLL